MELFNAISKRTSVRNFKADKLPLEDLKTMVEMAGKAPSINNSQPWKFIIVSNDEVLNKMADIVKSKIENVFPLDNEKAQQVKKQVESFSTFFAKAPAMIIVCQKPYEAVIDRILPEGGLTHEDVNRMRYYPNIQTIGAAIQNILLTAVELNYGACWLTGPNIAAEDLEELLNIKEPYNIAACVAVGITANESKVKEKLPVDDILDIIE